MSAAIDPAIDYLESVKYETMDHPRSIRGELIGIRPTNGHSIAFEDIEHDNSWCDDFPLLCTGDGYTWTPGDLIARFT